LEKTLKEAEEFGRSSFKYAWIIDRLKFECDRNVQIDVNFKKFETKNNSFTIYDSSGNRDFIKSALINIIRSDVVLLVIDSSKGGFEGGMNGEDFTTEEHVWLISFLNVKNVIVVVNKMDDNSINYSKIKFEEIKYEIGKLFNKFNFDEKKVIYIKKNNKI